MTKEFETKSKQRSENKGTFSVVMPNQPDHAANYRKVTGEKQKTEK